MKTTGAEPGLLGKLAAALVGAMLLVLGFMFSVVLLSIVAVVGLGVFGYFWWKTRELRKVLREQHAAQQAAQQTYAERATGEQAGGHIIEGEVIVVEQERVTEPTKNNVV